MVGGEQVGQYRVLQQIGEGGMGAVWLAEHVMLGRRAAIKVLHTQYSSREEIVGRFFNEARAATAISDPGIVQIFDFGHHVDGSAFIVMELIDGETLDKRMQRVGRLSVRESLRLMRQVASSLGAAHARGIVHRDLKPENIFVIRDSEVAGGERTKIVDFGIAKLTGDQRVKTNTQAVMGTPLYMSPEQCRGAGHVDHRSDVYSLGCVMFHLLTGSPPFVSDGMGELIVMHMREPAPAPSTRAPGIAAAVDRLVLTCLAKDPAERPASGTELAMAIGNVLAAVPDGMEITSAPGSLIATAGQTTLSGASGAIAGSPAKKPRPLVLIGIGVAAVGAGAVSFKLLAGGRTSSPAPAIAAAPGPDGSGSGSAAASSPTVPAVPAPPAPTPLELATIQITAALDAFVTWSSTHPGDACPTATLLGLAADPWGTELAITCTDQPANQQIGVVSAGPDRSPGTDDDLASWQLGRAVTDRIHGARWTPTIVTTAKKATTAKPKPSTSQPRPGVAKPASTSTKKPGPGLELDDNGLPIHR